MQPRGERKVLKGEAQCEWWDVKWGGSPVIQPRFLIHSYRDQLNHFLHSRTRFIQSFI